MMNELIKLSDRLDRKGLNKESDLLDAVIKKLSSAELVSAEEAMQHETHTKSLEQPGAAAAEAEEEYERSLKTERVIHTLVQGSGVFLDGDDDKLQMKLQTILKDPSHYATVSAIFEELYPEIPETAE